MFSQDRQAIIETNRSLRLIKNVGPFSIFTSTAGSSFNERLEIKLTSMLQELETLLEKEVISESSYASIMALLPTESSLSSTSLERTAKSAGAAGAGLDITSLSMSKAPPAVASSEPLSGPPPAYSQTPVSSAPALPARQNTQPTAPEKPILCKAHALYKYAAQDSRDCSFDKDDVIHVYEYMNADWWMGKNSRTGSEGIFPRTYIEIVHDGGDEKSVATWRNEKAAGPVGAAAAYPHPPPPGARNPYHSDAPPMAIADGAGSHHGQDQAGEGENQGKDMGKKFGKKLGNAAIFGAGATMGSKLVNSIF